MTINNNTHDKMVEIFKKKKRKRRRSSQCLGIMLDLVDPIEVVCVQGLLSVSHYDEQKR
jgi:hypothetical protein